MGTPSQLVAGTAWRFYDAIDRLLRTGDDAALRDVVAPDFVNHTDEPDAASGRDGLVTYLASLRATHPALRLVPEEVIAEGDRAVARLVLSGDADGAILGLPLAGLSPWPRIDVVRVRGDQIVERWGNPAGHTPSSTLYTESLRVTDGGDLVPVLERVTVAPGARDRTSTRTGPAILILESGGLDVTTTDAIAQMSPAGHRFEDGASSGAGQTHTLGPEDTLVVPEEVAFAIGNRAGAPAVMLLLTLVAPRLNPTQSGGAVTALPDAGITTQALAGNSAYLLDPDWITAGLARVVLAPGARLAAHAVAEAEFVAVAAGTVTVTVAGDEVAAWLRDPNGRSTAFGPHGQVAEGFAVSVYGDAASTSYRNETDRPVTLLLLTLADG